jgi:hypothetical protein
MHGATPALNSILSVLGDWVRGAPADGAAPASELVPAARQFRLEPLLHVARAADSSEAFRAAYQGSALLGYRLLQSGVRLCGALEERGIPSLGLRGPFIAAGLYGDPAIRPATDVDAIVPPGRREAALEAALESGFDLRDASLPRWFYRRVHLHWPLVERATGVLVDLHWSLDQPFQLHRVDYDGLFARSRRREFEGMAWREPSPEDLLLVSSVHLAKECRQNDAFGAGASARDAVPRSRNLLALWLDIALQVERRRGEMDWSQVRDRAGAWHVQSALACGLRGAQELFGVGLADMQKVAAASARFHKLEDAAWVRALSRFGGFRPACISEAMAYVFPGTDFLRARTRGGRLVERSAHAARAAAGIAGAAAAALCCAPFARARKRGAESP